MHSYLRSIGFSKLTSRHDLDQILGKVMANPMKKGMIATSPSHCYTEMCLDFGDQLGITVCGEYDEKGFFHLEHYFPYCFNVAKTAREIVTVNKRVDTDAYTGMCDDSPN